MFYSKALHTALLLLLTTVCFSQEAKWTNLLDRNLSEWEMYLSYRHKPDYKGEVPVDGNGKKIAPIGYNKNEANVFSIIEENKEIILRVSGEIYGCVFTKQEYENYHLKLQVKWGEKKWMPRTDKLRDTGILYHSVGECGVDYWKAWMLSQELQIMEGHVGDYWNIANSAIDVRAFIPEGIMNPVANENQPFLPIAAGTGIDGFCLRSENLESKPGEWTTVELICYGGKSLHIVNGKVVMVLKNSRYVKDGKSYPLTKGKIQLQSEGAEAYFKEVKIKHLSHLPKEWQRYFE
ncbi:3-keto-disaccharide hydrolase [Flavobacterium sp. PLA-1-15]|uniref:3-keto-disaccharide hydrolase n=1 Tax=Flavobacterium sp. PLA-1-15 TaxID=3380533 RepID=UPI003B7A403C